MSENKIPVLSDYADTDWSDNDLDNLIEKESGYRTISNSGNTVVTTNDNSSNVELTESNTQTPQPSTFEDPMLDVLEEETSGIDVNLQPSVTKTPSYNLDPQIDTNVKQSNNVNMGGNVYTKAFELMADLDLIRLPDDLPLERLDLETLLALKEETLEQQYSEVYEDVRTKVSHDPYMLDLLDYSMQGGRFVDLPKMSGLMQKEIDYRVLNLNDENVQKEMVKRYLSLDLNPNNDKDGRLLSMIPDRINNLVKNRMLREEAETARAHFLKIQEEMKRQEYARVIQAQEQEQHQLAKQQQEEEAWENAFRNSLTKKNWSDSRKEAVKKEYDSIRLKNGQTVPAWQYKQEVIFNNPALFQHFLDFTSKFDIRSNSFDTVSNETKEKESAVNRLIENLKNKNHSTMSSNVARPKTNNVNKKGRTVDPRNDNDWF